jgi:hypothetical protein
MGLCFSDTKRPPQKVDSTNSVSKSQNGHGLAINMIRNKWIILWVLSHIGTHEEVGTYLHGVNRKFRQGLIKNYQSFLHMIPKKSKMFTISSKHMLKSNMIRNSQQPLEIKDNETLKHVSYMPT